MNQSIRVDDAEGKLMFEFSLWALKEFWKGAGRKAEDFWVPLNEREALDLVVLAGLLEPEERCEAKVKLYTPSDWKPIPTHIELFQRDAKGEYVREAPKESRQEKRAKERKLKKREKTGRLIQKAFEYKDDAAYLRGGYYNSLDRGEGPGEEAFSWAQKLDQEKNEQQQPKDQQKGGGTGSD